MKSTVVFIVGVLLLSSFTASIYGLGVNTISASIEEQNFTMSIDKGDIRISYPNGQLSVEIVNISTFVIGLGKPRLPEIVRVVELPFGVKNVSVNLEANYNESLAVPMATSVSPDPYPADDFYYRVGVGLNKNFEHVTFVSVHWHPVKYSPSANMLYIAETANVTISYELANNSLFPENSSYDMVIIAPKVFRKALQKFVDYKNGIGIKTLLKTTEDIYKEYNGRDKPEQIKYFIKNAIETYGIRYVLLVGGLKSMIYAKPRDNANEGSKAWYLPVRYNNLYDKPKYPLVDISSDEEEVFDPGCLTDLYYADIYGEGGKFESWDPNDDGIIAAWGKPGVENDTTIDLYPDVLVGRLPCRNVREVVTVVNKIIGYEKNTYNKDWFKKMIVISGDGFLDQHDLDIEWDTTGVPNGEYTLYAQSFTPDGKSGPKDVVHFTLDRTKPTNLTFNHDDHLNPALQNGYPAPPIAEIVSISPGNTLGYDDYTYTPGESEAYCNQFNPWANVSYIDGILTIRGKSYNPEPYGNCTNIHVWIKDSEGNTIFSEWRNNTEMYYEGEWATGERPLLYRGGALYYMPEDFEREILWGSNGKMTGMDDVIKSFDEGAGFVFFSGHGSPNVWANHFPGVPGNRRHSEFTGLQVTTLQPWPPFVSRPVFPIDSLSNGKKLPVVVVGGCHNSMFNVSMIPAFYDIFPYLFKKLPHPYMWTFGKPAPECLSWRLVRNPHGGAIASIGNTGLGYGMPGKDATTGGGDAWITIEFFKQYGTNGMDILGLAYQQAITSYINTFNMQDFGAGHIKTVQEWVLFGDPSLKIGGYPED